MQNGFFAHFCKVLRISFENICHLIAITENLSKSLHSLNITYFMLFQQGPESLYSITRVKFIISLLEALSDFNMMISLCLVNKFMKFSYLSFLLETLVESLIYSAFGLSLGSSFQIILEFCTFQMF